jgi:hypothetical protein
MSRDKSLVVTSTRWVFGVGCEERKSAIVCVVVAKIYKKTEGALFSTADVKEIIQGDYRMSLSNVSKKKYKNVFSIVDESGVTYTPDSIRQALDALPKLKEDIYQLEEIESYSRKWCTGEIDMMG